LHIAMSMYLETKCDHWVHIQLYTANSAWYLVLEYPEWL